MGGTRRWWRVVVAVLLMGLSLGGRVVEPARAGAFGIFAPAAAPPAPLTGTVAVPLPDGTVLKIGKAAVGRYEPRGDSWRLVARMLVPRDDPPSVVLRDGRVLVVGANAAPEAAVAAEVYTPGRDQWAATGAMRGVRYGHSATLLGDGRVLVVGGLTGNGDVVGVPEVYDPATGGWAVAASPREPRYNQIAALLPDGRVLVAGGVSQDSRARNLPTHTAEIYDPANDRWSPAAAMPRALNQYANGLLAVAALPNGQVLVIGDLGGLLYNATTNSWVDAGPLPFGPVAFRTGVPLRGGRVLVADYGGVALYEPALGRFVATAGAPDVLHTGASGYFANGSATVLADGRVLFAGVGWALILTDGGPLDRCFAETGKCVRGPFLQYWEGHGGLALNGLPISDERIEVLEDGKAYTVQYFERVRLEYHPENAPPNGVLLGQFGRRVLSAAYANLWAADGYRSVIARVDPRPGARYFQETGHNVSGRFLQYWEANGGLAQFGYPITEERYDNVEDGHGYITQYFERARFEYHPENSDPQYQILLGQFGRRVLEENALLGGDFARLYFGETRVREGLGSPQEPSQQSAGALQVFEHGRMYWRGDRRLIYVFTVYQGYPLLLTNATDITFPDTWAEGQDPGGGPAPGPNLYLPKRGFGKLWRERGLLPTLGYATTPDEVGFAITIQGFGGGFMFLSDTPEGRAVYVVYLMKQSNGSPPATRWERYDLPR